MICRAGRNTCEGGCNLFLGLSGCFLFSVLLLGFRACHWRTVMIDFTDHHLSLHAAILLVVFLLLETRLALSR